MATKKTEKKTKSDKRVVRSVGFTSEQDEKIVERAERLHLDVSTFIRMAALNAVGAGHLETSRVKELEKSLRAVGGKG